MYKLKKIVGSNNFSAQFIKIISHYKKIGYNINVMQQTACLVVNPITGGNFAFLFNCTPVGRTCCLQFVIVVFPDHTHYFSLYGDSDLKTYLLMKWRGLMPWLFVGPTWVYLLDFFCSGIQFYVLLSPYLCLISFLYLYLYVLGEMMH